MEAADNKTPNAREQTLIFVTKFIVKAKRASVGQAIKILGPLLLKSMDDAIPEVREATYKAFGTLVGKVGERPMTPYLSKLDGIKLDKVKKNYPEKIFTGNLNASDKPKAKPSAAYAKAPAKKPAASSAPNKLPAVAAKKVTAPPSTTSQKGGRTTAPANPAKKPSPADQTTTEPAASSKPSAAKPTLAAESKKPSPKPPAPKKKMPPVEPPMMSQEEALEKAKEIVPESILALLDDGVFKQRLAGMS